MGSQKMIQSQKYFRFAAILLLGLTISASASATEFLDNQIQALEKQINLYEDMVKEGGWPSYHSNKKLTPGITHDAVANLREILTITGDLENASKNETKPFWQKSNRKVNDQPVAAEENLAPNFYDSRLEDAVKRFQSRHGLEPDGIVGTGTQKALNVPATHRLAQLMVAKERLLAFNQANPNIDEAVIVNIPGYRLFGLSDGEAEEQMKVIVGSTRHRTPLFSNQIAYVELNPQWYVPRSIATKEMLPKIKNDPSFVSRSGFRLSQDGQTVDANNIDWSTVDHSNFDFRLTQRSGRGNALGKVKFMIPDNRSIYLHDTSKPKLFSQDYRALSHGCIRLEDPLAMAKFILRHSNNISPEEASAMYESSGQKRITLENPINVHAVYWTAWVEKGSDQPQFYGDVYNRDQTAIAEKKRELEGVVSIAAND